MGKRLTKAEAIATLNDLAENGTDPEVMHSTADSTLLAYAPDEVREAYYNVILSADWWVHA